MTKPTAGALDNPFTGKPLLEGWIPPPAPRGWTRLGANIYTNRTTKLKAILSVHRELDGKRWAHLSISHPRRLPTYYEMKRAKLSFLGDVMAYQVFAPEDEHINIHSSCLHLWHCLDGPVLPDFTLGGKVL